MTCFIGVDISKQCLDVYIRTDGLEVQFPQTAKGIQLFLKILKRYEDAFVVFEASGGYEKPLQPELWIRQSEVVAYGRL
jgi:transposase